MTPVSVLPASTLRSVVYGEPVRNVLNYSEANAYLASTRFTPVVSVVEPGSDHLARRYEYDCMDVIKPTDETYLVRFSDILLRSD